MQRERQQQESSNAINEPGTLERAAFPFWISGFVL
jgi:hypothetical protein